MVILITLITLISLGSTRVIMILPPLLCFCKIHRILRILSLSAVFCVDITVGLLPDKNDPSDLCANRRLAGAALHSGAAALRAAVHGCTTAPPSPHLRLSGASGWRRGVSRAAYRKVQPRRAAHWLRCVERLSLLARLSSNPAGGSERSGAERDARRAHVVGGERGDTHREEEKERRLSCSSSPLTRAPDQPPQSAIHAELTAFPPLLLPSPIL